MPYLYVNMKQVHKCLLFIILFKGSGWNAKLYVQIKYVCIFFSISYRKKFIRLINVLFQIYEVKDLVRAFKKKTLMI